MNLAASTVYFPPCHAARLPHNRSSARTPSCSLGCELAEQLAAERASELQALRKKNEQLKSDRTHYCERVVLLEEELRWIKSQYFGTSSQKTDAAAVNPDQSMLFNEAEVLAAIEAAEEAHRQRTTKVEAHERAHTGGRKAIPEHFPRIQIEHDLPEEQKICTKCPVPHPLKRIGQETRECYRFQPPKISVEQHIRWTYVCEQRHEDVITAPQPTDPAAQDDGEPLVVGPPGDVEVR